MVLGSSDDRHPGIQRNEAAYLADCWIRQAGGFNPTRARAVIADEVAGGRKNNKGPWILLID
jgi:hypothetical protein